MLSGAKKSASARYASVCDDVRIHPSGGGTSRTSCPKRQSHSDALNRVFAHLAVASPQRCHFQDGSFARGDTHREAAPAPCAAQKYLARGGGVRQVGSSARCRDASIDRGPPLPSPATFSQAQQQRGRSLTCLTLSGKNPENGRRCRAASSTWRFFCPPAHTASRDRKPNFVRQYALRIKLLGQLVQMFISQFVKSGICLCCALFCNLGRNYFTL